MSALGKPAIEGDFDQNGQVDTSSDAQRIVAALHAQLN